MHGTVLIVNENQNSSSDMTPMEEMASRRHSLSTMAAEIDQLERKKSSQLADYSTRKKIHLCCTDGRSSRLARIWEGTLATLIVCSVIFYAFETYATKPAHRPGYPPYEAFAAGEVFFTFTFLGELIVRGIVSPYLCTKPEEDESEDTPFFRDALNVLDFVAILPWFLEVIFQPDTSPASLNLEFEIIKLLRVLRVFKIFRSFSGTRILLETAKKSLKPLSLTLMMLFMFMEIILADA